MSSASVPAPQARSLRVIFSVRPFRGHLHPLIPLARAFRRQGHRVAVATAEDMATVVTGAGLIWLPAGLNPRQLWDAFPDEDPDYGYLAVKAKVADLLEIAVEHFPPDVIIREPTDLAPAIAAEIAGAVHVVYGLGHFIPPKSWRILKADETIKALRSEYGLPEDPGLKSLYRDLYLSVLTPTFEGCHPLPVPAVQKLCYGVYDGGGTPVPAADAPEVPEAPVAPLVQDNGRPTILMTLGTVYNTNADLFSRFLEALGSEPVNVVCTLGDGASDAVTKDAPANVRFERYIPHSLILPHCQAMLCHAGFNTMMGCLSAGVPIVCVPLGSDQEYNARACDTDGLGLMLKDGEASPERIRAAVRRVLDEPSFAKNARAFREDMAHRPGFPAAVRRIEALAASRASRARKVAAHRAATRKA
jgi:UDP:flavonoid glycosyltransferase YjiC (YdhE family)